MSYACSRECICVLFGATLAAWKERFDGAMSLVRLCNALIPIGVLPRVVRLEDLEGTESLREKSAQSTTIR